jgi:hypothetical protein
MKTEESPLSLHEILSIKSLNELNFYLSGIRSPRISKTLENFFKNAPAKNYSFLVFDMLLNLKTIFMEKGKENPSDLLEIIENPHSYTVSMALSIKARNASPFKEIFQTFSQTQIKTLLTSQEVSSSKYPLFINEKSILRDYPRTFIFTIMDIQTHYHLYPEKIKTYLLELDFSQINTLTKLHDVIARETKRLSTEPFSLDQEKFYPNILNIDESIDDYKIVFAKSSSDLITWGQKLGNCIGGGFYAKKSASGQCLLLALEKNGEVCYTVELTKSRIIQFEGKSRHSNKELETKLVGLLKTKKIME